MNCGEKVAILILLELTLQFKDHNCDCYGGFCRNPYFIGINSAIIEFDYEDETIYMSQSLFYWN